jgi:hypothetical protein
MIGYMNYRSSLRAILLIPAVLLSGCASISVFKEKQNPNAPFHPPTKIYVRDFSGEQKVFRVDRKEDSLTEFQKKITAQLSKDIVKKLNECVAPSERIDGNQLPKTKNAWIIEGSFDRVNQGSRMMRALIGLGAGGTKVETSVRVLDANGGKPLEILSFRTTGGSNTEPGPGALVFPTDPTDIIMPFVWSYAMTGLTKDTSRTAKEIAAELSDYLQKHGVKPKDPKLKVKRMRGPRA